MGFWTTVVVIVLAWLAIRSGVWRHNQNLQLRRSWKQESGEFGHYTQVVDLAEMQVLDRASVLEATPDHRDWPRLFNVRGLDEPDGMWTIRSYSSEPGGTVAPEGAGQWCSDADRIHGSAAAHKG